MNDSRLNTYSKHFSKKDLRKEINTIKRDFNDVESNAELITIDSMVRFDDMIRKVF